MAEAATAAALSAPLLGHLRARIAAEGPMPVASFMEEALFHPRFGYYATRDPLGACGDFITAPEMSQAFGELLGLWCADLWQRIGAPRELTLVELGPGRGTMMADALRAARIVPGFCEAARLHLVERGAPLRAAQERALAHVLPRWHDDLDDVPDGPMILLANEFLDALPVRQFVKERGAWRERLVGVGHDGALLFVLGPSPAAIDAPDDAEDGAVRETRPAATALAQKIAARLRRADGGALVIDYGYAPSACGDTLQAMRRHKRHDILSHPGAADLTAHVDFAAFAGAAERAGARAWGPVPQGVFLFSLGIEARARQLIARASDEAALLVRSGCRRLVDPAEMGTLFNALALTAADAPAPAGFA